MQYIKITSVFFVLPVLLFFQQISWAVDYDRYMVAIHLDSDISGAIFPPEKLVEFAAEMGFDAVIFGDHVRAEVEYGIFPFRNIVKKRLVRPSVNTFGEDNYLDMFEELDRQYPTLTVIPGMETGPHYYWTGNPFSENLVMHNWHRHMLVFGLKTGRDFRNIPTSAAKTRRGLGSSALIDILALGGIFLGVFLFRRVQIKTMRFSSQLLTVRRRPHKIKGIMLIIFCLAILVNDFPFTKYTCSPYRGDLGEKPAQDLIDYVRAKGGLVYYAHPEADTESDFNGIKMITESYVDLLLNTHGYTGFAVFCTGWREAGKIGGVWDQTLNQYCTGERKEPPWIISELDFEGDINYQAMRELTTYIWAEDNSREALLNALSIGRCYASEIYGSNFVWLDEYYIKDAYGEERISGETLTTVSPITLRLKFTVAEDRDYFEALIIRNGSQIATIPFDQSFEIDFEDDPPLGKNYYRVWTLYYGLPVIATNPIFVVRK